MKLHKVKIRNFRSIADLNITFEQACQILVGMNECGKTNILKALRLLSKDYEPTPDDLREITSDETPITESHVWFVFRFDANDKMAIHSAFSEGLLYKTKNPSLAIIDGKEMTSKGVSDQNAIEGLYCVDIEDKSKYPSRWRFKKPLRVSDVCKAITKACPKNAVVQTEAGKSVPLTTFKAVYVKDFPDIPEAYLEELTPDGLGTFMGEVLQKRVSEQLPNCIYWEYKEKNLLPGKIALTEFARSPETCVPLKNMFHLAGIDNIEEAITKAQERANGLRNLLIHVADRTTKHIHGIWKESKGIKIYLAENGAHIDAGVQDKGSNNVYNFDRRSDGFKRFITFLLLVSAEERTNQLSNTLILIDEPDICLHPSGAKLLRDELIKISSTNFILFSTHSIFMIDRENTSRHLIVTKDKEITTAVPADMSNILDEEVIYNAMGTSVFENLKPKNIVFEGWRDKLLFRTALQVRDAAKSAIMRPFKQFGTCHAEGVKDIPRLASILDLANRQFVIISDDDDSAIQHQRQYHGSGGWVRYSELLGQGNMTSEDFIKTDVLSQALSETAVDYESLRDMTLPTLDDHTMRIEVIKRWLISAGLNRNDGDQFMRTFKDRVFANLEPRQIDGKYFDMLTNVLAKFETQVGAE